MGLLTSLVTLPVTGPARGALWVLDQVVRAAESQLYDEDRIMIELRGLHAAIDEGQLTEAEYELAEAALLERLTVARERRNLSREDIP